MPRMVSSFVAVIGLAIVAAVPGQLRAANLTTLVSFCALTNCTDGDTPYGGLIADAHGNLFGTTSSGGAYDYGTVFEIAKTATGYANTPTILVSFNLTDGASPRTVLIADARGNLFGTTEAGGAYDYGTVFKIAKTATGYASNPTTVVSFNFTDGATPLAGLIADANGNLFGTTSSGGTYGYIAEGIKYGCGTVFEIAKTPGGYASTPTTLVSFNLTDGATPYGGLIADADGNLFGTTLSGGAFGWGTVFKIAKIATGYASTPTTLVSFNGFNPIDTPANPPAGLIVDANGNLFGTTYNGGANHVGAVFEITDSGFVVPITFAGTPGQPNCFGKSGSALARQHSGLNAAAAALGYPSVRALENAIDEYCEG